jgi:hypothetical protein
MSPPRAAAPAASRIPALFVALLVCGAFLARVGELSLVRHALCQHGELIHAGEASPAHTSFSGKSQQAAPTDGSGRRGGEHEHCDARAVRFDVAELFVHAIEPVRLLSFLDWTVQAPCVTRPADVLALAPKTSPPAA